MMLDDNPTSKPIIVKLGGSVISHSNKLIDFNYLREFRDLIKEQVLLGKRFVIILGGGQTCRQFIDHARSEGHITKEEDLHWIGTAVNTLNAEVVRSFLGEEICEPTVWKYDDKDRVAQLKFSKPVAVAGGFEAGKSGDWVALRVAQSLGVFRVLDLKAVNGVYDKDPKDNPDAKMYERLSWKEYLDIIGNPEVHTPGNNNPVDPVAAVEAKELGAEYYIIRATDFDTIEAAMNNEPFVGTLISDRKLN
jgi:uridylate kinase